MDIYIKPYKKISLANRSKITVGDVCEVFAPNSTKHRVEELTLLATSSEKHTYLISVLDIVAVIDKQYPDCTVSNMGEYDTIVEYAPQRPRRNVIWSWAKAAFVALVLFAGACTAIICFHNDAGVADVFQTYYSIIMGEKSDKPLIIYLPYSIGLAVGIIGFFNRFGGRKITDDPTPIEVEISSYDDEITRTLVDKIGEKQLDRKHKGGGGNS